jgi:hypothetical protein
MHRATHLLAASMIFLARPASAQGELDPPPPEAPAEEPAPPAAEAEPPPPPPAPPPGYGQPDPGGPGQQPGYGPPGYGPPGYGPPGYAQPYGPYPYPPPGAYYEPPPAPVAVNTGAELHEGFYLRFGIGLGALGTTVSYAPERVQPETSITGPGAAIHFMIGGSPADGLAIGFALLGMGAGDANVEVAGTSESRGTQLNLSIGGLFVDGFPDPKGGFDVGGMVGLAEVATRDLQDGYDVKSTGLGAAAWVGYTAWVGEEWSIGGLLWLAGATTSADRAAWFAGTEESFEEKAVARSVVLSFSALYH